MTDLQTLFLAVNDLNVDEIDQLEAYLEKRRTALKPRDEDVETKLAELHAALAEFREGLTEEELERIRDAITINFHYPMKDLAMYNWMDDIPEEER